MDESVAPTMMDDANSIEVGDSAAQAEDVPDAAEFWAIAPPPKRTKAASIAAQSHGLDAAATGLAEATQRLAHGQELPKECITSRRLRCPFCDFSSHAEHGLTFDIGRLHAGEALGEQAVHFFRGLDRGLCEECGHLRCHAERRCVRCNAASPARAVVEGDVISSNQLCRGQESGEGASAGRNLEAIASDGSQQPRSGQLVRATVDGISEVTLPVTRQRRGTLPAASR